MSYHLAHFNVARQRATYDDPLMAGFVTRVPAVNALADAAPGFVWRLGEGSAEAGPDPFGNPLLLTNLSLWADVASLRAFVYAGDHAGIMRERSRWFLPPEGPPYVLWWVPAGERPLLAEARRRWERLAADGPTPEAFTFARAYAPPG